jgi:hypothetical protein
MRRSKKKAKRLPPMRGKRSIPDAAPIVHRDVKPFNGRSLGFGRDKARATRMSGTEGEKK